MAVYNTTPHHTNFFSVTDNFFVIDSLNLEDTKTKLYGFFVHETGIYDEANRPDDLLHMLDGRGGYVFVEKTADTITVMQDFIGCYGLCLYRQGERFVLSNSFLMLTEYLRTRVKLTLNKDYANHFLIIPLGSKSYSQTMLNEVELLPRNVIVRIDIKARTLSTERIDYGENTIPLDSREGMDTLDRWFAFWTRLYRKLRKVTPNISVDLSGGMDSRITFLLALKSGMDLGSICIHSEQGKRYTFEEDYKIASEISARFGFPLNNEANYTGETLNLSLEDSINIPYYAWGSTHKQVGYRYVKYQHKRFNFRGSCGETIREYWQTGEASFLKMWTGGAYAFSGGLRRELAASVERIATESLEMTSADTGIPIGADIAQSLDRETGNRSHFGGGTTLEIPVNHYKVAPLADPLLQSLKLNTKDCPDRNLLMAVIYARYCPDLLKFRFAKNECISPETIKAGEEISRRFPITADLSDAHDDGPFSFVSEDKEVTRLLPQNNPVLENGAPEKYYRAIFDSRPIRKLFTAYFDEEIYFQAEDFFRAADHGKAAQCHAIMAVVKALIDSKISQSLHSTGPVEEFNGFLEPEAVGTSDAWAIGFLRLKRKLRRNLYLRPRRLAGRILRKLGLRH